jgi:FtsH-binding integral membrane protein
MPTFSHQLQASDLDHGTSRLARWLQTRWMALGAWIAVIEGVLVLAHSLSKTVAIILALGLLAAYTMANRSRLSPTVRIGARIVAFSQALVLLIPLLVVIISALVAVVAVALIAVLAVALLVRERR